MSYIIIIIKKTYPVCTKIQHFSFHPCISILNGLIYCCGPIARGGEWKGSNLVNIIHQNRVMSIVFFIMSHEVFGAENYCSILLWTENTKWDTF